MPLGGEDPTANHSKEKTYMILEDCVAGRENREIT